VVLVGTALCAGAARSQDATWSANPGTSDFNTAANWTPATVPTDTGFFGASSVTNLSFSADTTIGGWTFNPGASNYTFTNAQTLQFNGAGIVVNGGSAAITNNGNLLFNNNSSAGSAIITNNSGLEFNNASTAGTATIANNTNGVVSFNDNSSAGNATITNSVLGQIVFIGASTAGNATITNNSNAVVSLSFGENSSAGNATIINNSAGMIFFGGGTAGNATITNNVALQFDNSSTAGNATITNNDFLVFTDNSSAGSATITNNGATFAFGSNATAGNATITTSTGADFESHSSAGNAAITVNGGELDFSDNSTAGNASITTNSGATTLLDTQASGGNARFILNGTGTLDISGLTTGGTTAGSIEGDSSSNVRLGAKNLTVGSNNLSTTFSGVIQDGGAFGGTGGSLTKVGTGTLTLSGINAYTGATAIDAGTLDVDGAIANSSGVTVNSGGTLSGTGIVTPATTIMNGGALSPGNAANPTGTLTITGNLAFQSGALYLVQVTPSAASSTVVGGTASLAGTVEANFALGSFVSKQSQYTILTAAGGLGGTTFGSLGNVNLPPGASDSLSYDADHVYLNLTVQFTNYTGLNQNQQNVANGLNNYFNANGGIPAQFFGLTPAQLTQIDGENGTDADKGAFQFMTQYLSLMLDPFVDGRGGFGTGGGASGFAPEQTAGFPPDIALAYASVLKAPPGQSFDQRWTTWGATFGGYNKTNGDPVVVGSTDVTAHDFGFAGGMDYRFSPDTLAGFSLAGGGTNWGLAQGLGGGRSDAFAGGVYAKTRSGPWYVAGALAFADHWFTTNRTAAFGDQLTASFNGQSYGGRVETGYRYAVQPTIGVTPYAALQAQSFHTPSYSETDVTAGGFGLTYNAMNATDTRGELGARFDDLTMLNAMPLILRSRLAWAHDWESNPALGAVFQTLPGASFIVNGAPAPKNSALASASAELHMTANWSLAAKFDGEFANGSQTYAGTGTLRYQW
jgi:autotransporter-associated beta strand protein